MAEIVGSLAQGRFQGAEILTYDLSGKGVGITDFGPFAHSAGNRLPPRLTSRIAELKGELERGNIRLPSLRQRTLCNCR